MSLSRRWCARGVVALAFAGWPPAAYAGDAVTLRWAAPEGCPGVAALRADLEQLAGRRIATGGPDALDVEAHVTRDDEARWTLQLSLTPPGGPPSARRIEGRRCDELARATVSIVALALDPLDPAPEPPRRSDPPPPPPPPTPQPPRPAPPDESPSPAAIGVGLSAGADATALPGLAASIAAGAFLSIDDHHVELRGLALLPRDEALDADRGGTFSLFAGALRYGHRIVGRRLELRACAGFEAGWMHGEGHGFDRNVAQTGLWLAPTLGAALVVPFDGWLAASLDVEGLVPLVRDRYRVAGADVVHRTAPLDARALLGVRVAVFH